MKYWNALTEDAQDTLMIVAFLLEVWILFGVMA